MKFLNGFEIYTLLLLAPILIDYNTLNVYTLDSDLYSASKLSLYPKIH